MILSTQNLSITMLQFNDNLQKETKCIKLNFELISLIYAKMFFLPETYLHSHAMLLNTLRNRDTQCHHSGNFASRDMTFGQLKSSYFEECDGVHNSKLWIVEI